MFYLKNVLEHFRLVVLLVVLGWTLAARTSWASVIAARTPVVVTTRTTIVTTVIVTTRTSVTAWLALRLDITLRFLDEGSA